MIKADALQGSSSFLSARGAESKALAGRTWLKMTEEHGKKGQRIPAAVHDHFKEG